MRRLLLISAILCALLATFTSGGSTHSALRSPLSTHSAGNVKLSPETLQYKVMFKWGLINKKAGSAELMLKRDNDHYSARLVGTSEPWADRIFRVRDTLIGRMSLENYTPLYYEKIAHEGNDHKHDVVKFIYKNYPPLTQAECIRKVWKKGELKVDETRTMESAERTVDMLTSFYFMRSLPYQDWKPGTTEQADIFSGKAKERLSIVYQGKVNLDIDGKLYPTYHITFKFTSKGGRKSSDDMDGWISADSKRIPLRLEGKLPVGKVHCIYTGTN